MLYKCPEFIKYLDSTREQLIKLMLSKEEKNKYNY